MACAAFWLFARTMQPEFDFVNLDDPRLVLGNPAVRHPSSRALVAMFRDPLRWWSADVPIPRLTAASLMLDGWLGGPGGGPLPGVFHRTAVLLHVLNTVLVFGLLRRLGAGAWGAAALAAVFAAHPMQVESVAWISQRATLLGATFALMAVRAYLERPSGGWRGGAWFGVAMVFALLAALANPAMVGLPVVFLLLDGRPLRRFSAAAVIEKLPLMAVFAAGPLMMLWREASGGRVESAAMSAAWMIRNVAVLMDRLVWPRGLSPINPNAAASVAAFTWNCAAVVVLALVAWRARRRWPMVSVGLAGFVLMLLPSVGPPRGAPVLAQDHAVYLPLVFLLMPAAAWMAGSAKRQRGAAAAGALAVVLATAALPQVAVWRDGETLFRHAMRLYPDHAAPKAALADWMTSHGRAEEAAPLLRQAVDAEPTSAAYRFHLGNALLSLERTAEAMAEYEIAVRQEPKEAGYRLALGSMLAQAERWKEACGHFEAARDASPQSAEARMGLGFTYLHLGWPAAARAELQEALSLRPGEPRIHLGLACAWARMNVLDKCRAHLAAAVTLDPSFAGRAGREPALRDLAGRPGFEGLITTQRNGTAVGRGGKSK